MAKVKKVKKKTAAKKKTVKPKPNAKTKKKKKAKKTTGAKRTKDGQFAKGTKLGGRKTTLSTAIATQLAQMWRHKISDQIACEVIGITINQLKQWLKNDQTVTIIVKRTIDKKEQLSDEIIGLQHLRARERGTRLFQYMERYEKAIDDALSNDQYRAAIGGMQFIMEKQWPKVFGKDPGGEDEDKPKAVKFPLAPPPKKKKPTAKTAKKSKK